MTAICIKGKKLFTNITRNSIRYNFIKNISIILLLSTLVLSVILAINEASTLSRTLQTKGKSFASYIAKLSQDPLIMKDGIQLDSIVNDANKDEDIMYAIIRDTKGNLVTSQYSSINYRSPLLTNVLLKLSKNTNLEAIIVAIRNNEPVMELSVPILTGSENVGQVTICMSKRNIWKQISKIVLFVIALNMIVAIVLGTMVFIVLRKTIFAPVTNFAHVIGRRAQGDLSARITDKATGELQMLFDGFNQMAEISNEMLGQIQSRDKALTKARDELEQKVEERTRDLIQENAQRKLVEEKLRESEQRYREISIIDNLTQLYNSMYFYEQLKMEIERANRYGQPLTLLLLDLDDFKQINDTYGHIEGDRILSRFGQLIKTCMRQTDSAYRYGGDEFIILLPMSTDENGVVTADRIRVEFKKEIFSPVSGKEDIHMTVSIGLAQYKPQEDLKAFVQRVDQLMYQAKKNGKDRVYFES